MTKDEQPPPRSLGASREVSLTGKLIVWDPVVGASRLLPMAGTDAHYVGVFTDAKTLREVMAHLGITNFTIRQIQDHREFLESIPSVIDGVPLHVAVDMRLTEKGTLRFAQWARD